jgi:hypothetical protein
MSIIKNFLDKHTNLGISLISLIGAFVAFFFGIKIIGFFCIGFVFGYNEDKIKKLFKK